MALLSFSELKRQQNPNPKDGAAIVRVEDWLAFGKPTSFFFPVVPMLKF